MDERLWRMWYMRLYKSDKGFAIVVLTQVGMSPVFRSRWRVVAYLRALRWVTSLPDSHFDPEHPQRVIYLGESESSDG
jgi:hypothetical protein